MSLLLVKRETLPEVDAVVITQYDLPPEREYILIYTERTDVTRGLAFENLLRSFLSDALDEAAARGYTSVALTLPLIYDRHNIIRLSRSRLMRLVSGYDIDVYIVVDERQQDLMRQALDLDGYLYPTSYSRKPTTRFDSDVRPSIASAKISRPNKKMLGTEDECHSVDTVCASASVTADAEPLEKFIRELDDTFAVRLLKLIDVKGMDEVECYKAANVSRQTWYKIMNEKDYRPSKSTVICFAIALKLTLEQTQALLATAGYTLSGSILFDKIIAFCIREENYDIFEINNLLYAYDQECLGA